MKQGSKNISIKMLKDVGMTVLKSKETNAVYICNNKGDEGSIIICSGKKGDEGCIYAARQGMKACNNNNMCKAIDSYCSNVCTK